MDSMIPEEAGPAPALEPLAMAALDAGRILMESGASAASVDAIVAKFARGLGADRVDLRIGYASLAITIGIGPNGITRMREVGHLGVNQRMDQELWRLAERVSRGELTVGEARAELDRLSKGAPRHSAWVMAVAVGLACAAFGRLLNVDWLGTGPVFLAAMMGAGLGFLWYNSYPAEVFMGDTGSLALGGLIGLIAFMVQQPLTLIIVGGVFVWEALSVIIQVGYFKATRRRTGEGRRFFLMAPVHHHFQRKGWPETKVVLRFWILSLIFALAGLGTLKLR